MSPWEPFGVRIIPPTDQFLFFFDNRISSSLVFTGILDEKIREIYFQVAEGGHQSSMTSLLSFILLRQIAS